MGDKDEVSVINIQSDSFNEQIMNIDIESDVQISDIPSDVFIKKVSNIPRAVSIEEICDIPTDVVNNYEGALKELLPDKSNKKYFKCFDDFADWQTSKGIKTFIVNETVMLGYFGELAKKYQPSTLWTMYSMLKSTIICSKNIDVSKFSRLIAFLQKKNDGFRSKKSKVFSAEDVKKFLVEAPDNEYLLMKTVLVFGVVGACRGDEITNIKCEYVRDTGKEIVVKIPDTKTKVQKAYVIDGEFAEIVRKYMKVRPASKMPDRFFLQYRNEKCTLQPQGKTNIAKIAKKIAQFLELPEYEAYTGHSFRRTSTTILADSGAGIDIIRRHGQWKSNAVAEGYIQESLGHKRKIASIFSEAINLPSNSDETFVPQLKTVVSSTVTHSSGLSSNLNALPQNASEIHAPAFKTANTSSVLDSLELSGNAENGSIRMSQRRCTVSVSQQTLTMDKQAPVSKRGNCNQGEKDNSFNFSNCSHITIHISK